MAVVEMSDQILRQGRAQRTLSVRIRERAILVRREEQQFNANDGHGNLKINKLPNYLLQRDKHNGMECQTNIKP